MFRSSHEFRSSFFDWRKKNMKINIPPCRLSSPVRHTKYYFALLVFVIGLCTHSRDIKRKMFVVHLGDSCKQQQQRGKKWTQKMDRIFDGGAFKCLEVCTKSRATHKFMAKEKSNSVRAVSRRRVCVCVSCSRPWFKMRVAELFVVVAALASLCIAWHEPN